MTDECKKKFVSPKTFDKGFMSPLNVTKQGCDHELPGILILKNVMVHLFLLIMQG